MHIKLPNEITVIATYENTSIFACKQNVQSVKTAAARTVYSTFVQHVQCHTSWYIVVLVFSLVYFILINTVSVTVLAKFYDTI